MQPKMGKPDAPTQTHTHTHTYNIICECGKLLVNRSKNQEMTLVLGEVFN